MEERQEQIEQDLRKKYDPALFKANQDEMIEQAV